MTTTVYEKVRLPGEPVDATAESLLEPTAVLLRGLWLLGSEKEMKDAGNLGAAFLGPPQSVALIEANATALAKAWAGGLGVVVAGVWGSLLIWWDSLAKATRDTVLWGAALTTVTLLLAIALIIATDVRSRAMAATATIRARAEVARAMIEASSRCRRVEGGAGPGGHEDGFNAEAVACLRSVIAFLEDGAQAPAQTRA